MDEFEGHRFEVVFKFLEHGGGDAGGFGDVVERAFDQIVNWSKLE